MNQRYFLWMYRRKPLKNIGSHSFQPTFNFHPQVNKLHPEHWRLQACTLDLFPSVLNFENVWAYLLFLVSVHMWFHKSYRSWMFSNPFRCRCYERLRCPDNWQNWQKHTHGCICCENQWVSKKNRSFLDHDYILWIQLTAYSVYTYMEEKRRILSENSFDNKWEERINRMCRFSQATYLKGRINLIHNGQKYH